MVELIEPGDFKSLHEITNPVTFTQNGPTQDGLYSEVIFKSTIKDNSSLFAYINLGTTIVNPIVYNNLNKLDPIFKKIVDPKSGVKAQLINGVLVESPNGKNGVGWLYSIWDQLDFTNYYKEGFKDFSEGFSATRKDNIFLNKIIVMPPLYRPWIEDRGIKKEDEITVLYKDILRITRAQKGDNEFVNKMLDHSSKTELIQQKVNALHEYLIGLIAKSDGFQEGKLIGKRMNNVARLTANASPRIPLDTVGVPWHSLINLIDMFVISEINHSPDKANIFKILELPENTSATEFGQYFDYIYRNVEVFTSNDKGKKKREILIEILKNIIDRNPDLRILLKRDPSWDVKSYHSMKPIIITDNAFHVVCNSMVYKPLGGDSFSTKICGTILEPRNGILLSRKLEKVSYNIKMLKDNNKVLNMKSLKHYIDKVKETQAFRDSKKPKTIKPIYKKDSNV